MSINTQILKLISQRNLLLLEIAILRQFGQYPIGFWQGFINMNKSLWGFLHHQLCMSACVCMSSTLREAAIRDEDVTSYTFPNSRDALNSPTNIHLKWMIHLYPEFLPDYQIETSFCCSKCKAKAVLPPQHLQGVVSRRGEGIAESTIDLLLGSIV